ncbi:hypothetical protein PAHAL_3G314200 [Panicum hallii]|uniref:Uncharacterized protein n=1 Tax=Panicum hallii TaxID=206008 RepID=A0A2S3HCV8_9POAL|nr:uncharacterized protein LOC112887360 [Panicum hallii]PAN20032.1 hypothetical protein PAHAL_3G314200 [Panicum hallii]
MGKKRAAAASAAGAPVFPFPAFAAAGEQDHFSDYGFDSQLVSFFAQAEAKRSRRHHSHHPPPLEPARFKLQKPISKKHHHLQKQQQQRRHRWWSSAASAALLLFKRPSSSSSCGPAADSAPAPYGHSASAAVPLYLADDGDGPAACACWAPSMRSGRLAAAELGAAAQAVPYVSLGSASLGGGGAGAAGGGAPATPIYLVT